MSILVAFRKEWLEQNRSYRLLIVGVVLVFFGLISPLSAKMLPELLTLLPADGVTIQMPTPTVLDAITQYIKNMAQFGLILAVLLTMGVVAQEKDKGTAAMMLVKPMPRGSFLGAKFVAIAAMFALALVISAIACYYYTLLLFEAMDVRHWLALNGLLLLYILVYVAITLLGSTLMRSQIAAGGVAVGMIIVLGLIGSIPALAKYLPGELISWGGRLMLGDMTSSWGALGVSLGLIAVALLVSWVVFRRQEL